MNENILLESDSKHHLKDVFVWCPGVPALTSYYLFLENSFRDFPATRAYYYTSLVGDYPKVDEVRGQLRALQFDPQVFKKLASKSKGVDIALTKDMLMHAFEHHYDVAMLFAGDRDYVPLIEEVKRRGKNVWVCFFAESGSVLRRRCNSWPTGSSISPGVSEDVAGDAPLMCATGKERP